MIDLISRHKDIVTPTLKGITIVGAGGIGSPTALLLAKMGYEDITVIDFDQVNEVNLGSQMFRVKDIGKSKVEALKEQIFEYTTTEIKTIEKETDGKDIITNLLILAVDDIDVRKMIAENAKYNYLIDGRMGGQTFTVLFFDEPSKAEYLKTIFPKSEASEVPCSAKAICYNTFGCSSFIANTVKRLDKGESIPSAQHWCFLNLAFEQDE